jgi:hypothetical protein
MDLSDSIEYNDSLEGILSKEAEKCLALRWSHDAAQRWCASKHSAIMIPSILLSSLASVGSFGGSNLLPFEGSDKLIGFLSLAVATISTIGSFYGFSKRAEAHRVAALLYGRLHRWLTFQLSLPRNQRIHAADLLKVVKEEGDRLNEISPQLPSTTIQQFKQKFQNTTTAVPEILNGLERVEVFHEIPGPAPAPRMQTPKPKITVVSV